MGKTNPEDKSKAAKVEIPPSLFERVFLPWTAILILAHALTMYVAPAYMWGIHFYHFFPAWIGWALALLSLVILVPPVGQYLSGKLEVLAQKIGSPFAKWGENKTFLLLSVLSLPIFWLFRDRMHLLGDGMFRITDLPEGKILLQEWLDGFIHVIVYRVVHNLFADWTPELTYALISVLCGGAFVFLALKLSSLLGKTGFGKVLIFSFLITLGSVQLFFGYVESYTSLQVALLAYVLFAVKYLSGKVSILPVLVVFMISVGLHITSLIYLPSFIYLLRKRPKGESAREKGLTGAIPNAFVLASLIVASFLVISWVIVVAIGLEKTGKGIFIVPLRGTHIFPFSMFSLAHISEFVNQLLLLTPLGISLSLFFLFFKLKNREFRNRLINFLILAACFALVYLFVVNFTLGSADWDLRSSPAVFFALLGVLTFLNWGEGRYAKALAASREGGPESAGDSEGIHREARRYRTWGLILIWFGLFHTAPWILLNASQSRSVDRYVMIQEMDPHPVDESGYNLYKVARILKWAGLPDEIEALYSRAIERDPSDTMSYYNLAAHYYRTEGYLDQAGLILDTLLKMSPGYCRAHWLMANVRIKKQKPEEALPYLERASPALWDDRDFLLQLATAYYLADRLEETASSASRLAELNPRSAEAYRLLGSAWTRLGRLESARDAWRRYLLINPSDTTAVRKLKELEARAGE